MADKEKPAPKIWHPVEIFVVLLFLSAVVGGIVNLVTNYLSSSELTFFGISLTNIKDFFFGESLIFKFISVTISVGSIVGVVLLSNLKGAILIAEKAKLFPYGDSYNGSPVQGDENNELKEVWKKILQMSESTVESDWRVAIIEADIILEDLLYKLRLPGETIGEKLKAVEKSDFQTLDEAWEAHKFRNNIAHSGSNFLLNQREVRRIISLYEKVFKEFYLI